MCIKLCSMKNYILGIIRLSLPLFASVAVAGVSAPPSGTVFNYTVFLGIDCKATPPTVTPNEDGDAYLLAHSSHFPMLMCRITALAIKAKHVLNSQWL